MFGTISPLVLITIVLIGAIEFASGDLPQVPLPPKRNLPLAVPPASSRANGIPPPTHRQHKPKNPFINKHNETFALSPEPAVNSKCPQERRDKVGEILLKVQVLGYKDFVPPKTDKEFRQFCQEVKSAVQIAMTFVNECLNPLAGQISRVFIHSVQRQHRDICRSRRRRNEALAHFQCIQPKSSGPLHECATAATTKIKWLSRLEHGRFDADFFMPSLCCITHEAMSCVTSRARSVCRGHVANAAETADYISDLFVDSTEEAMVFCGRFSSLETCRLNMPQVMEQYDRIEQEIKEGRSQFNVTTTAMVVPIFEIFERKDFTEDD